MSQLKRIITEAHHRSLWQVLGVYLVASWIIYQVVLALFEGLGLPEWVPGTAVVLLLLGLPVVLATAFVQEGAPGLQREEQRDALEGLERTADAVSVRQRALEGRDAGAASPAGARAARASGRPSNPAPSADGRVAGLFTWSKAITGGVLAFAVLGLAASGFMGMRALGIGPAATLISSGQLEDRAPVVLADFESLTGDAVLSRVVTEAFRADLVQSDAIRLASASEVSYLLARMARGEDAPLDAETAREVATRGGMKAVVAGDIGRLGGRYVLSARVVNPMDGEVLVAESETAVDSTELVAAIGRLARSIREEIGEPLRSIRRSPYLTAITTPSLPALKLLIQAYDATNRGEQERALRLLGGAIELDPEFSEAHRKRAAILGNNGRLSESVQALEKALANPERLTPYERHQTRALYLGNTGDYRASNLEYLELLDSDSTDSRALNNLGTNYLDVNDFPRAEDAFRRAAEVENELEPGESVFGGTFWQLAAARWTLGHPDSAEAAIRMLERIDPGHPLVEGTRAVLDGAAGQYDSAAARMRRVMEAQNSRLLWQWIGHSQLARGAAARGRLAEAREELAAATRANLERDYHEQALAEELYGVMLTATVAGDPAAAVRSLEGVRARYDLDGMTDPPYPELVWAYAAAGQVDSARTLVQRLRERPEWWLRVRAGALESAEASVAMAEGDWTRAAELWRAAIRARPVRCPTCFHAQLGTALEQAGEIDGAMEAYTDYLETRSAFRLADGYADGDGRFRGYTLERLAMLHEDRGERARAAGYYAEFVELWKDADPELQPRVESARRALARLTAEGG